jgi:hypothetical protein
MISHTTTTTYATHLFFQVAAVVDGNQTWESLCKTFRVKGDGDGSDTPTVTQNTGRGVFSRPSANYKGPAPGSSATARASPSSSPLISSDFLDSRFAIQATAKFTVCVPSV